MPDAETATAPATEAPAAPEAPEVVDQDALDAQVYAELNDGKAPDENHGMPPAEDAESDEGPARGPDGKFQAKDEPKAEKATEKKIEPKKDAKPADRDQRRKLIAAKEVVGRILKWDDDKIDAMDDGDLIDLGQRLKPTFETVESLKADLQKWKDRARGQKAADTDTPDNGPRRSREPVDKAESDRAEPEAEGIDQLLSDYLDPETLATVKSRQRAERARFQDQADQMTERAEAAETALRNDRIETGRGRVAEKFPQLNDDAKFTQLLKAMDEMDPDGVRARGDLPSFLKFMERVAWSEFGEDVERTTRQRLLTGNRKDIASQPRTSSQASHAPVGSEEDYDNAVGRAAVEATSGGTFNQAKFDAIVAKIPKPRGS